MNKYILDSNKRDDIYNYLRTVVNSEFDNVDIDINLCLKCNSKNIVKLGNYGGRQRYRCKDCLTSFTSKSFGVFSGTKLDRDVWLKYIDCFINDLTLRECAKEVSVSLKTSFFMRKRIIECLNKSDILSKNESK